MESKMKRESAAELQGKLLDRAVTDASLATKKADQNSRFPIFGIEDYRGRIETEVMGEDVHGAPQLTVEHNGQNKNVRAKAGKLTNSGTSMLYDIHANNGFSEGEVLPDSKPGEPKTEALYKDPEPEGVRVMRRDAHGEQYDFEFDNPITARKFGALVAKQVANRARRTNTPSSRAA